jgi:hypothetical protein
MPTLELIKNSMLYPILNALIATIAIMNKMNREEISE